MQEGCILTSAGPAISFWPTSMGPKETAHSNPHTPSFCAYYRDLLNQGRSLSDTYVLFPLLLLFRRLRNSFFPVYCALPGRRRRLAAHRSTGNPASSAPGPRSQCTAHAQRNPPLPTTPLSMTSTSPLALLALKPPTRPPGGAPEAWAPVAPPFPASH